MVAGIWVSIYVTILKMRSPFPLVQGWRWSESYVRCRACGPPSTPCFCAIQGYLTVSVSWSCCNKEAQNGWLRNRDLLSHSSRGPKCKIETSFEIPRKSLFYASLPASGGFWQSFVFLGSQTDVPDHPLSLSSRGFLPHGRVAGFTFLFL